MNRCRVIHEGRSADCKHENQRPDGYGTACHFMECVRCGAVLSFMTERDTSFDVSEQRKEPG